MSRVKAQAPWRSGGVVKTSTGMDVLFLEHEQLGADPRSDEEFANALAQRTLPNSVLRASWRTWDRIAVRLYVVKA